jgi:hypothetical protein
MEILLSLLTLAPILLILGILYLTSVKGKIQLMHILVTFAIGTISIPLTYLISSLMGDPSDQFNYVFYNISLVEELSKFMAYLTSLFIIDKYINQYKMNMISFAMLCGVTGLSFAWIENIKYCLEYGTDILLIRTFSATILHLTTGMLMGYWIALGNINRNRTLLDAFFKSRMNLKFYTYSTLGLISATTLHGIYDYNIFFLKTYSVPTTMVIVMLSVVACRWILKDLNNIETSMEK